MKSLLIILLSILITNCSTYDITKCKYKDGSYLEISKTSLITDVPYYVWDISLDSLNECTYHVSSGYGSWAVKEDEIKGYFPKPNPKTNIRMVHYPSTDTVDVKVMYTYFTLSPQSIWFSDRTFWVDHSSYDGFPSYKPKARKYVESVITDTITYEVRLDTAHVSVQVYETGLLSFKWQGENGFILKSAR